MLQGRPPTLEVYWLPLRMTSLYSLHFSWPNTCTPDGWHLDKSRSISSHLVVSHLLFWNVNEPLLLVLVLISKEFWFDFGNCRSVCFIYFLAGGPCSSFLSHTNLLCFNSLLQVEGMLKRETTASFKISEYTSRVNQITRRRPSKVRVPGAEVTV